MSADKKVDGLPENMQPIDLTIGAKAQRQDVVTLSEDAEHQRVVIRKFYNPIIHRLWDIAVPHMINHHTDLLSDAVELSNAKVGDKFLWGWRVTGTTLIKLEHDNVRSAHATAKMSCPVANWYVVEVIEKQNYHAAGYVVWTNSNTWRHLLEVILNQTK